MSMSMPSTLEGLMSMKNDSGAANMGKLHQVLVFKMYMDPDCSPPLMRTKNPLKGSTFVLAANYNVYISCIIFYIVGGGKLG